MGSDIFIKTGNTDASWTSGKAKNIFIKTTSSVWTAAKNVWLYIGSQWTRVWPLSGVFAETDPYIATSSSSTTHLTSASIIKIGDTYYGKNGSWNANGWSITGYDYQWYGYNTSDPADNSPSYQTSLATYTAPVAFTISGATQASNLDRKYLSFFIQATSSGGSSYNGSAESGHTDGRIYVIRKLPVLITPAAFNSGPYYEGSTISYTSGWDTAEADRVDSDAVRTALGLTKNNIKWYYVSSLSNIYAGGTRTEITRAANLYSWTIQTSDNLAGKYIIAEETVFNSGSDYVYGNNGFSNGINQTTIATQSTVISEKQPGAFTISSVTKGYPSGTYSTRTISASWAAAADANSYDYQIEKSSDGTTWSTASVNNGGTTLSYANFNTTTTSFSLSVDYAKYYRVSVRAKSPSGNLITYSGNNPFAATGTAPGAPTGLSVTLFPTYVYVTYTATTSPGSNTYTGIQYSTDNSTWFPTTTANPITISGLTPGGNYTVYIRSVNEDGLITSTPASTSFTTPNTYSFSISKTLYVGTNGYVSLDQGNAGTGLSNSSGRVLAIAWTDMIQAGDKTGNSNYTINYYCNGTKAIYQWYGYRSASQTAPNDYLRYWVRFDSANPSYADVYYDSIGANVASALAGASPTALGMYYNGNLINQSITKPAAGSVYRFFFDGSSPTLITASGSNFISTTDFLNNLTPVNQGLLAGYDDSYTSWTTASGQYYTPTVSIGSATLGTNSLSFPITLNYSTTKYDWDLRTTSYTGTVVSSGVNATSTSVSISGLTSGVTYYLNVYPKNDQSDSGTTAQSNAKTTVGGLTPTFGTNTATASGFTGSVNNYDANYSWSISTSLGSVAFGTASGSTYPFTVTGLSAGQSATVTVTTTRSGYTNGSGTTTGFSYQAGLTPTFGSNSSIKGGFTGSVSNYDSNYSWGISTSAGSVSFGSVSGSTYPFTVTGLSSGASATVTVTTSRSGYTNGSGATTGSAATTYTLTYDANTGTGSMTDTNSPYIAFTNATVLSNGFTAPTGKTFANFNTIANGTGTTYNPTNLVYMANNITLYAQWVNAACTPSIITGGSATRYTNSACNYTYISWTADACATSYEIWQTTSSTATPTTSTVATFTSTTNNYQAVGYSTLAYYFVRGVSSAGKGTWSARITPALNTGILC